LKEKKMICRVCEKQITDADRYPAHVKRGARLCKSCSNERNKEWKKKNPEQAKIHWKKHHAKVMAEKPTYLRDWHRVEHAKRRLEMVSAYGGKCQRCGIDDPVVLDIDHIKNDGGKQRSNGFYGWRLYRWLRKNGWPKDNYQLLCRNCNWKKEMERRPAFQIIKGIAEIERGTA
jgi:transposase-like protein